jgi:hypothetical protein
MIPVRSRGGQEIEMGLFITLSASELEEFEKWRRENAKDGQVIVIEGLSRRRPDSFKVWFEKPLAEPKKLRWYKPMAEKGGKDAEPPAAH